jgi:hypothetical protein
MTTLDWAASASQLHGSRFADFQVNLTRFNSARLVPTLPGEGPFDPDEQCSLMSAEREFLAAGCDEIAPLVADIPADADAFMVWYENLSRTGPGQGDPLFPWLATTATAEQMNWFLQQEVAGEAGFEDLLALTQVKFPVTAKLEMARNYWDEMGRGRYLGMHGPMLERLAHHLNLAPTPEATVPEALALGNAMIGMALNRDYAFHSAGALGAIEMTAPVRAMYVDRGLRRLMVSAKKRHYFAVHAVLDVRHSEAWNREVIRPLVAEDGRRAQAIGEGAVLRLWYGSRCFARYRDHFGLDFSDAECEAARDEARAALAL